MITLRPATMDDRDLLQQWRHDYKPVEAGLHEFWVRGWVERMKECPREGLYIAEVDHLAVGTGRITASLIDCTDVECPRCDIHYFIALGERRKGYGRQLVQALVKKATEEMGYKTVSASIERQNWASFTCALMGGVHAVEFL